MATTTSRAGRPNSSAIKRRANPERGLSVIGVVDLNNGTLGSVIALLKQVLEIYQRDGCDRVKIYVRRLDAPREDSERMNERKTCPNCKSRAPMSFIWPSPQKDKQVEQVIGRFQRCEFCSWSGDALTGQRHVFGRIDGILYVDRVGYPGGVAEWLRGLGIIQEDQPR